MMASVTSVYERLGRHVAGRIAGADGPRAELAALIRATVDFIDGNRTEMIAPSRMFISFRDEAGASRSYDAEDDEQVIGTVEAVLRRGQEDGVFRAFDPFVMGSLVQRSIDGLPFLLETRPDLDLHAYAEELVETFDVVTRPIPPS